MKIERGVIGKYAKGWYREGEECVRFIVREAFDDVHYCYVQHLTSKLFMQPIERLDYEMIEPLYKLSDEDIAKYAK